VATLARLVAAAHRLDFTVAGVRLPLGACRLAAPDWRALLQRLVGARPDRLALFAFGTATGAASVRRLPETGDAGAQRRALFEDAIELLGEQGYVHLGLGQFALRSDVLAVARAQGRLFVDLEGLHDQPCADLVALGAGAAGQVAATYYQNAFDVADYEAALAAGQLPVARGLALTRDDLARRSVIQALVCQGRVDFESIRLAHLIEPKTCFARELDELSRLVQSGLATVDAEAIELPPAGCRRASAVAAVFDRHLRERARRNQCVTPL
jgi:oxygen-independent coproporphyrinogen-3 oxidase